MVADLRSEIYEPDLEKTWENETDRDASQEVRCPPPRNGLFIQKDDNELVKVRERGYPLSDGKTFEGFGAVASPIIHDGAPLGSIAVFRLENRFRGERFTKELPEMITGTANAIGLLTSHKSMVTTLTLPIVAQVLSMPIDDEIKSWQFYGQMRGSSSYLSDVTLPSLVRPELQEVADADSHTHRQARER